MPLHDLGYRTWNSRRAMRGTEWTVIADPGIRRGWQVTWLRRMLLVAWVPAMWLGVGFFMFEQALLYPDWRREFAGDFLQAMPETYQLAQALSIDPSTASGEELATARHTFWAWFLQTFLRYPQAVLMVIVVGFIAPPLISQDVRTRAFLLYFSRPITRVEYVIGKAATVWFYLSLITMLPAFGLYCLGVMLSPSLDVVWHTWDLPLRIIAASVVLMLPTTAVALFFSSLTQESRYARFAWFAVWILGWVSYGSVRSFEQLGHSRRFVPGRPPSPEEIEAIMQPSRWTLLSPYHTLGEVQSWVFGFRSDFSDVLPAALMLSIVTIVSLTILFRRVSAPMRA